MSLFSALIGWNEPPEPAAMVSGTVVFSGGGANQSQDLARAVVYIDTHPALASESRPSEPSPQIIQRDKAFVPDLLVVPQGTAVEFPNWDPFSHNVFSRSRAASFDLDRYGQGQSKSYTFDTVGVIQVFCNIHPQMRAVVLVVPNRFYVRADAQGRFTLQAVPPGKYVLVAWHSRFGEQRQKIDVPPEGLRNVTLTLAAATVRETSETRDQRTRPAGVERGLGVKRERLNLPVVHDVHPAPKR